MKAVKKVTLFILILLLAFFLRFFRLGSFPPGFTWDEAAIGYNAWGILTVHRDEWLSRMPLTFRSFGDYKSPLAIYITAVSEGIFGPRIFAVRFPTAVASLFLVVGTYFLTLQIFHENKRGEEVALLAMFLTAISPWALHFSGIAFESVIAGSLSVWGTFFFLRGLGRPSNMIISGILYSLSLYAYHSAKIVVPLIILILILAHRQVLKTYARKYILFFLTCLLISAPLVYASLFGKASDRFFGSTVILTSEKKLRPIPEVVTILSSHFVSHLTPSYLFFGGEQTYRQSNKMDGILSPLEGMLIASALFFAMKRKTYRRIVLITLLIICVSIIPATLGNDVPHANRAFLDLPWFQILGAVGFLYLWEWLEQHKKYSNFTKILGGSFLVIAAGGLLWHIQNDNQVYASSAALRDLQYGYEQAVMYAKSQESSVRKVYFTNTYGQAYIYLLFFKHLSPIDYRGGGLSNYVISDHPYEDARGQANVLIVGTPQQIPDTVGREKEFKYPDGKVAFRVVRQ